MADSPFFFFFLFRLDEHLVVTYSKLNIPYKALLLIDSFYISCRLNHASDLQEWITRYIKESDEQKCIHH